MATIRKIISYDDLEDKDIKDWIDSLPPREQSKYIRLAIRTYLNYLKDQEEDNSFLRTAERKAPVKPQVNQKKTESTGDFVDINNDFLDDLGK